MLNSKAKARGKPEGTTRGGTLGSRRRPPNEARSSILAAADRLFYAGGIGAIGVDAVADAAGVTKRTLYYHFASKDELTAAYLDARDEATRAALREAASSGGDTPRERILSVFDFLERWFATPGYRGCPFNNAVAEQNASPRVTEIAKRHKAAMRAWFAQQAAEGGARHPAEVGAQLLVLLDGALNGAAVSGTPEAAAIARRMAETVLSAAGIEPSKGSHAKKTRR